MSTLPLSQFDLAAAPRPMQSLTHVMISPQNVAMEARLNRAKPLGRGELRKLARMAARLEREIQRMNRGDEIRVARFHELRELLTPLSAHRKALVEQRQLAPDAPELRNQWEALYEIALPLQREYTALYNHFKKRDGLIQDARNIRQRIADNPKVIEKQKEQEEEIRLQKEEAKAYEQFMIARFSQLGYCYRWSDKNGNKRVDEVRFSEVHITMDAVFFKVAASYRSMFGGWKTRLPYGVRIADLLSEQTQFELAMACQRQVSTKATSTGGAWIIVHRLDTNDGLLNEVRYSALMSNFPPKLKYRIAICAGVTHHRNIWWLNFMDYPHMLVAGFTGSGKSNFVNAIICCLISIYSPEDVRLVLVDLKDGLEFDSYSNIPHLHGTIVDKVSALADRLQELEAIMGDRNQLMRGKAKTIHEYNAKFKDKKLPRIICIIDEVASIMAHGELTKRINNSLRQLTAKGRASGIHIILSTQRPSVDAIDGGIKVNLAARIVGRMPSHTDSLTVLGTGDAKELAAVPGRMLLQIGPDPIPLQTPFVDEGDILQALKVAMEYPTPEPIPVPENANLAEEWTPEKLVELSLKFLGGNIGHTILWKEIKDEGGISQRELREMVVRIWQTDCIPFDGKEYRVERSGRNVRRLVEIPQPIKLSNSE